MKLVCRDCEASTIVADKHLKTCPQCGSANVDFGQIQDRPRNTMANVKIIFGIMGISGFVLIIIAFSLVSLTYPENPWYALTHNFNQLGTNFLLIGSLLLAIPLVFACRKCLPDVTCPC